MTESEAKQKWCPMRRITEVGNVRIHNTEPAIAFTLNCIGSACMMWRWNSEWLKSVDNGDGTSTITWAKNCKIDGGCGLAGNP